MPKSVTKWLLRIGLLLFGAGLLILALPSILGAKWIYGPIVQSFAKDKLLLEIGEAKLAWFTPLELNQIKISDIPPIGSESVPLIAIDSIKTDRGLFSFLWDRKQLGTIEIIRPKVEVALLENESNVQRLIASLKKSHSTESSAKDQKKNEMNLDVLVRELSVQVTQNAATPNEAKTPLVVVPPFDTRLSYRSVDQEPSLDIAPTKILDRVVLTPELVKLGVGHAAPLLAKSAWFDGTISLACDKVHVPLDHPIDSEGRAVLTMHQVRTGPSEPLLVDAIEFLASMREKSIPMELVFVDGSQIEVGVKDRYVSHKGLEAGLPKLDQRLQISSQGSVGLENESLQLVVEVPVPIEQIARRDSVKELGVPRLKVPVVGTLKEPKVEWQELRKDSGLVLAMMAGQLQNEAPITSGLLDTLGGVAEGKADDAIAAAAELAREIRERRQRKKEESQQPGTESESEKKPSRRPLLDALRKSLRP